MEIIPAIMPRSYFDLEEKINQVVTSVPIIQLDLMDGKYVNGKTWPFDNLYQDSWLDILQENTGMPDWENIDYEIDLMINDIPIHFNDLVKIGPKRIIFHFPTGQNKIDELKDFIKNLDNYFKYEIELGIAYEHGTNPNDIMDLKDEVKFVQCMGIDHVGVQGANFDQTIFERISFVKENLPNHIISVDGGVNIDTIKSLRDAGVTRFVCGSAIFKSETPSFAINDLFFEINND